jgi:sn-glycerol 3-phosphate transport system permease protein
MATSEVATNEVAPVGIDAERVSSGGLDAGAGVGRSARRRTLGVVGQYAALVALAALVLGPVLLTIILALSPPFRYALADLPLHPVDVAWKDRTWFTGGLLSIVVRTLVVVALLAWLQKVAGGASWAALRHPARLGAIGAGVVVLAVGSGPVFGSFHAADGRSQFLVVALMAAVALTQFWGFRSGSHRSVAGAGVMAGFVGVGLAGAAILFVGPEVWTGTWGPYRLGPTMARSLVMTVLITVMQVITSILAAYAFVFLRFPFKRLIFALFMATLLLPLEVTLVGNVTTIRDLELTNTMAALVLPFGAFALGTFLIRQGFRGLPPELRDATRLDGYGHIAFLVRFAVPLTRPVVASFTVIAALAAWNQYLWPRAVIDTNKFNTLQIQLSAVATGDPANANLAVASALVAALPVVLLLIAFQRQIIRGLTAGAVK